MPVTRAQAKEICTKPEFELVEASFRPAITALTAAQLRAKVERARSLQDKNRDLSRQQSRGVKETGTRKDGQNARTERKAKLFIETRERFEKRLGQLEARGTDEEGGARDGRARASRAKAETRSQRRQTKRDLG
jgi:hypothetical protein